MEDDDGETVGYSVSHQLFFKNKVALFGKMSPSGRRCAGCCRSAHFFFACAQLRRETTEESPIANIRGAGCAAIARQLGVVPVSSARVPEVVRRPTPSETREIQVRGSRTACSAARVPNRPS